MSEFISCCGGRGPPGQRVDQLVEVLRLLGEELAVLLHELLELFRRVLAAGIGVEHVVERGHHLADALEILRRRVLHGVAHAGELRVEHLTAQQVLDLLVRLARLGRTPLVVGELPHRARRVARQLVEFGLGHPRGVRRFREQRAAFLLDRLVEQLAHLLQRAVQAGVAAQFAGAFAGPAAQLLQPGAAVGAAAQQPIQRLARRHAGQHVVADLVQRGTHVVGRFERIRTTGPAAVSDTHSVERNHPGHNCRQIAAGPGFAGLQPCERRCNRVISNT